MGFYSGGTAGGVAIGRRISRSGRTNRMVELVGSIRPNEEPVEERRPNGWGIDKKSQLGGRQSKILYIIWLFNVLYCMTGNA